MFRSASSFSQTLCGAWKASSAVNQYNMFYGSRGRISTCTSAKPETTPKKQKPTHPKASTTTTKPRTTAKVETTPKKQKPTHPKATTGTKPRTTAKAETTPKKQKPTHPKATTTTAKPRQRP